MHVSRDYTLYRLLWIYNIYLCLSVQAQFYTSSTCDYMCSLICRPTEVLLKIDWTSGPLWGAPRSYNDVCVQIFLTLEILRHCGMIRSQGNSKEMLSRRTCAESNWCWEMWHNYYLNFKFVLAEWRTQHLLQTSDGQSARWQPPNIIAIAWPVVATVSVH